MDIDSTIPVGAGLGSSAAFAVAISASLCRFYGHPEDHIAKWAFIVEQIIHGNPSGIDDAVVYHGGLVVFKKEQEMVQLAP